MRFRWPLVAATVCAIVAVGAVTAWLMVGRAPTGGAARGERPSHPTAVGPTPATVSATTLPVPSPRGAGPTAGRSPVAGRTPPPIAAVSHLSGTVMEVTGRPLSGATVKIIAGSPEDPIRMSAQTDASGRFVFSAVPAKSVNLLTAAAKGYETQKVEKADLPIDDLNLYLAPLSAVQIEVLRSADGVAAPLAYQGPLNMVVLRKRVGTTETLGIEAVASIPGMFEPVKLYSVQIQGGGVRLEGLEAGTYKLGGQAGEEYSETEPFSVEAAGPSKATLVLGTRQQFAGRARSKDTGKPVAGASARLMQSNRPPSLGAGAMYATKADATGRFSFSGVIPGTYTLDLGADGLATKTVEEIRLPAQAAPPPEATYDLVGAMATVTVTVADGANQPVEGAPVVLYSAPGNSSSRSFFWPNQDPTDARRSRRHLAATRWLGLYPQIEIARRRRKLSSRREKTRRFECASGRPSEPPEWRSPATTRFQGVLSFVRLGELGPGVYAKSNPGGAFTVDLEPGTYVVTRLGVPGTTQGDAQDGRDRDDRGQVQVGGRRGGLTAAAYSSPATISRQAGRRSFLRALRSTRRTPSWLIPTALLVLRRLSESSSRKPNRMRRTLRSRSESWERSAATRSRFSLARQLSNGDGVLSSRSVFIRCAVSSLASMSRERTESRIPSNWATCSLSTPRSLASSSLVGGATVGTGEVADSLVHVTEEAALANGQADDVALLAKSELDGLADPEGGVGAEPVASSVIELVDHVEKPDVALLDQISHGNARDRKNSGRS